MKKKKSIAICLSKPLLELIDNNFVNKSKLIEWCLIQELSKNDKMKECIKKMMI
jgi:hypothetical protein